MKQTIVDLRRVMAEKHVDWYLVLTDDFHASEYVGDYFKCRKYLSGFTGSAGTLLVGMDWAGLWTDGRYFLQAADQLAGTGIELMKLREPGVPEVTEFIRDHMNGGVLGFDGRTVNVNMLRALEKACAKSGATIVSELDLAGDVWPDRPALSAEPVWELTMDMCGRDRKDKLAAVRKELADNGADVLVISSLMDVCWLCNIRGGDVACTPVVLSFMAVTAEDAVLFINESTISAEIRAHLEADGITIRPYEGVYEYVKQIPAGKTLQMNFAAVNAAILRAVPAEVKTIDKPDPTRLPKAMKNATEVANMRLAHVKDGVAVTRFMKYVKENVGKVEMDELSVADVLEGYREQMENYIGPSFHPIMGYGPHGAIVHYGATKESCAKLEPRSFLLSDTGGHYKEGTTDITRTFALGELTEEEKHMYTLVLKGHLALGAAHFKYGATGMTLDILARKPLWDEGLDFNHGTGHGVGYILSVHEGPQSIHFGSRGTTPVKLEEGMITSDEPGMYLEGKFGVRLENLIVCVAEPETAYGKFMHFDYLTMVPWDLDAVDVSILSADEKKWLNEYHALVYEKVSPYFDEEEKAWLKNATRAV